MFRIERHTFLELCDCLRQKNQLKDARHILVEEQLTIFMKTIGLRETNRDIVNRFQHSENKDKYYPWFEVTSQLMLVHSSYYPMTNI